MSESMHSTVWSLQQEKAPQGETYAPLSKDSLQPKQSKQNQRTLSLI